MTRNFSNNGSTFEGQIETILKKYASAGFMRVKKVEQPIKVFGPPGRQRVIHLENPFVDFIGAWTERGGRLINFEAKSTLKPVLRLGDGGLSETQATTIHLWEVAGAVSFLLWEFRGEVRLWTNAMIARQAKDWKHLKFENGFRVAPGLGFVFWDFRLAMLKFWPEPRLEPMNTG